MRAGPLSSPRVLERLERDFVNAWILHQDLAKLFGSSDPAVAATAKLVSESYLYPVDSQVLSPDGELLDHVCANDLDGTLARYQQLLDAAMR